MADEQNLESLWDKILSRDPEMIRLAYYTLDHQSRSAVLAHLQNMSTGAGWHPEQRVSAHAALKVIAENPTGRFELMDIHELTEEMHRFVRTQGWYDPIARAPKPCAIWQSRLIWRLARC